MAHVRHRITLMVLATIGPVLERLDDALVALDDDVEVDGA